MSSLKFLGKYYLLDSVGQSAVSSRWRAVEIGPDGFARLVLIDRLTESFLRDELRRSKLEQAVEQLRTLMQPNLVQLLEFARIRDEWLLVQEYAAGTSLRRLFARLQQTRQSLPLEEGIFIGQEILRGLEAAERFGLENGMSLFHGHIHPGSILLGYEGEVRVSGVGVATLFEALDLWAPDPELAPYRRLEQSGAEASELFTDLFSVAAILHEMLAGKPFQIGSTHAETQARLHAELESPQAVERVLRRKLAELLAKAVDTQPEQRFASAGEMSASLELIVPGLQRAAVQRAVAARLWSLFEGEFRREKTQLREDEATLAKLLGMAPPEPEPPQDRLSPKVELRPAAKADAPATPKAEPRPVPKAEAPAAAKAEHRTAQKAEPAEAAKTEHRTAPKAEAPPTPKVESRPAPAPRSEPQPAPKADPWAAAMQAKTPLPTGFVPSGKNTDEPPSGIIHHDQMATLLESMPKGDQRFTPAPKEALPAGFVSSGKNTDEPPSGLIHHDEMSTLLDSFQKHESAAAAPQREPMPLTFTPSGKPTDAPPSGLIPAHELSSLLEAAAKPVAAKPAEPAHARPAGGTGAGFQRPAPAERPGGTSAAASPAAAKRPAAARPSSDSQAMHRVPVPERAVQAPPKKGGCSLTMLLLALVLAAATLLSRL